MLAHLKLPLVENVDQIVRNQLRESCHECIELLFDALVHAILDNRTIKPVVYQPYAIKIKIGRTHSTYSILFSSVTGIFAPPSFKSIVTSSPNRSSTVVNVSSIMSVISCSL